MTGKVVWAARERPSIDSPNHRNRIGPVQGCLLHFDASASDIGSLSWLADPRCKVSYHEVILDDGSWVQVVPPEFAAYHAGKCRPSSRLFEYHEVGTSYRHTANHAFLGIAIANGGQEDVTPLQLLTTALRVRFHFERLGWPLDELWRITTHSAEAWPRGRKTDPEGPSLVNPIMSAEDIRLLLPYVEAVPDA